MEPYFEKETRAVTSPSPPPFLACLACGRVTPVPPQLSTQAVVRCPHCHIEFSLKELMAEPTATWELVSDREQPELAPLTGVRLDGVVPAVSKHRSDAISVAEDEEEEVEADYADVEPSMQIGAPPRKLEGPLVGEFPDDPPKSSRTNTIAEDSDGELRSEENVQAASFGKPPFSQPPFGQPAVGQLDGGRSSYAPRSHERRARKKRPRSSPVWSVLQIALGGMAAIPISLLLMWHLLGTDIGDAAPWVAQYAPWIVPAKFRPYSSAPSLSGSRSQSAANANRSGSLPTLPAAEVDISVEMSDGIPDEFPTVEPRSLSEPSLSLEPASNHRRVTEPLSGAEPSMVEAELNNIVPEASLSEEVSPELAPVELEPTPLEICFARIRQTEQRLEEWPQAFNARLDDSKSRSQLSNLAHVTYGELTSLAVAIDELSAIDKIPAIDARLRAVREQLDRIGQQVEQEPEVRHLIQLGARFWVQQQLESRTAAIKDASGSETVAAESKAADEAPATANLVCGLAMTVELDSVMQSADGHWWLATPTLAAQLGEPPLEIRIPDDLTIAIPEGTLATGQSLFLLGTVRPLSEEADVGSNEAPQARPFVASYLYPL